MLRGLVEHEHLEHEPVATEESLRDALFGAAPAAQAVIGCVRAEPIAYAVFYPTLPTAHGRPSLYLEDLFVESAWRGQGLGTVLLDHAIAECRKRGCGLVQLTSDKTRTDARRFYERLGFVAAHEGFKLQLASE